MKVVKTTAGTNALIEAWADGVRIDELFNYALAGTGIDGTTGYEPTGTETGLVNPISASQLYRGEGGSPPLPGIYIQILATEPTITLEVILQWPKVDLAADGTALRVREFGIFDAEGTLLIIGGTEEPAEWSILAPDTLNTESINSLQLGLGENGLAPLTHETLRTVAYNGEFTQNELTELQATVLAALAEIKQDIIGILTRLNLGGL